MDKRVYWIWMQQAFLPGSRKPWRIVGQYRGGAREFCEGGPKLWNSRRDLTDREAAALRDFTVGQAEARLEYALRLGWQVISPECEKYPELLKNIPDPPAVLYVKGEMPDLNSLLSIGIAGARKATEASLNATRKFGYQLAAGKACVVSGGAKGVDAAALTGAMGIPGSKPISVLPVSLDSTYVTENSKLRSMICAHGGALVTEYFSQLQPDRGTFAVRNRLITGLSRGVLLIQAARKSGTMIYASHALEQNRDVFVWPGELDSDDFAGSRDLLTDGARAVYCGEDILAEYDEIPQPLDEPDFPDLFEDIMPRMKDRGPAVPVLSDAGADLSQEERQVLAALGQEPLSVAQLEELTGMRAAALLGILTELEVEGLAVSLPGKRYMREM